jgi:hypothetical protein
MCGAPAPAGLGADPKRALACLALLPARSGMKREPLPSIRVAEGETDMAQTAQIQFGAEARRSPRAPEILPARAPPAQAAPAKRSGLGPRVLVVAIVALLAGGWYWLYARQYEDIDDAQIGGNISAVSPRVQGTVTAAHTAD